jgi:hypothetical protein
MFDRTKEITVNTNYEERLRRTAQENYATRVERANRNQPPFLVRLSKFIGSGLVQLGTRLQRQPRGVSKDVMVHR